MFPPHLCTLFHACIHYFEFLSTKPELSPLTKRIDNSISMRWIKNEIIDKINEINNIITKSICDLCNIVIKCCFLLFIHLIITVRQKGNLTVPIFKLWFARVSLVHDLVVTFSVHMGWQLVQCRAEADPCTYLNLVGRFSIKNIKHVWQNCDDGIFFQNTF